MKNDVRHRLDDTTAAAFMREGNTELRAYLAKQLLRDRRSIAEVLADVSNLQLSGKLTEASTMLTDVIVLLRWDGKSA